MQPGMTASGTIQAVKHGMDALHITVKKAKVVQMIQEKMALDPSLTGLIATKPPQAMLRVVVTPLENIATAIGLEVAMVS